MSHTPGLVKIHDQYKDQDVRFVALTDEGESALSDIDTFAQKLSVPWPIGYGARETTMSLNVPGYPTTFVIGRDGKVVWNSFKIGTLDGAIRTAL